MQRGTSGVAAGAARGLIIGRRRRRASERAFATNGTLRASAAPPDGVVGAPTLGWRQRDGDRACPAGPGGDERRLRPYAATDDDQHVLRRLGRPQHSLIR